MPIGTVPPPAEHPDEAPMICIEVNREWIPIILGALQPLKYPEYWSGTLEENRQARKDFGILLDQIMRAEECGMSKCCEDQIYIYRIDPETGRLQRSLDDGTTWTTDPADPVHQVTKLPPIVGDGLSKTKCDAATNFTEHFEDIITASSENIGTAITVFELAAAIAAVIIDIIVAILTEGAGAAAAIAITDAIFAACAAAFAEGKTAFDDYWTNERKDQILCAAFATIGDNGQFSQTQWEDFKHKVRVDLTAGAALDLVLTAVNAGGYVGATNMASYGSAALSDCSACTECTCTYADWILNGTFVSCSTDNVDVEAHLDGGVYSVYMGYGGGNTYNVNMCRDVTSWSVASGDISDPAGYNSCHTGENHSGFLGTCAAQHYWTSSSPFVVHIVYGSGCADCG